ncbi:DegT/DnrJ/EryC1/StrS family aminotransferase [Salisediminibacterium halotolerans]|uniref:Pyridoxal phosphate-dependent aminotransferase EpsN n=1 Tax=Salisediminibacterium halotolerans TaxID=517425 RepID=A0A1H9QHA0_9BACI|nr:aminotransferase class I/II-fold pyridoxal phosphate-dependent enzyme [Salisediminibacterium haloalkalitolerans]SER59931.1 pyridoxal phosphate-dependent aminotransferase EpsN [Salisediminibacterium haloalkalitolerans]
MTNERILLSTPHMTGNEQKYINEAFESNWIAPLGPNVDAFEQEIADYVGVKAAAATSSGTAAIHLALRLLGVGPGDTVFCSSLTFVASANPILYQGADPIFIDSELKSWNMCPQALAEAFQWAETNKCLPKAIIVVNLYGQSADMDPIIELCERYNVPIIEDAAESLGAEYKGKKSGSLGHFGVFSFNGNKIISTSGGGMLVSNDEQAIEKARFLSTQARDPAPHYQHSQLGYNYRMSNVLAGIGRAQLEAIDTRVKQRREKFHTYESELNDLPGIEFMPEAEFGLHNRWLTTMLLTEDAPIDRDELIHALANEDIESRPVWKPMHLQPSYEKYYFIKIWEDSLSKKLFRKGICLPSSSSLSAKEQKFINDTILIQMK